METTPAATKKPVPRSKALNKAIMVADALAAAAYRTYDQEDWRLAARAYLEAALVANAEKNGPVANDMGKRHADCNKKACGG